MQHQSDTTDCLYTEYYDSCGFVIREIPLSKNPLMAFQAGKHVRRAMQVPIYVGNQVSHHRTGDDATYFEIHGNGRTKLDAINAAADKLIRDDIRKNRL